MQKLAVWMAFVCGSVSVGQQPQSTTKSVNFLLTAQAKIDAAPLAITVKEHKADIPVESVRALDNVPHRYLLLADTSGSERMQQHTLRAVLRQIVADAPVFPRDSMALAAFDSTAGLVQPFTTDRKQLADSIERLKSTGSTALYDAIIGAVGTLQAEIRKSGGIGDVIVITDGEDNASRVSVREAAAKVAGSGVRVSAIILCNEIDGRSENLKKIVDVTGGLWMAHGPGCDVVPEATALTRALHNTYLVRVTLPAATQNMEQHKIDVSAPKHWKVVYPRVLLVAP